MHRHNAGASILLGFDFIWVYVIFILMFIEFLFPRQCNNSRSSTDIFRSFQSLWQYPAVTDCIFSRCLRSQTCWIVILVVEMMTQIKNVCFIGDRWIMAFGFITCSSRKYSHWVKQTTLQNQKMEKGKSLWRDLAGHCQHGGNQSWGRECGREKWILVEETNNQFCIYSESSFFCMVEMES